jgi:hypothetical protein
MVTEQPTVEQAMAAIARWAGELERVTAQLREEIDRISAEGDDDGPPAG